MNELQHTLSEMVKSGSKSNPAMNTIINDYAKYHAILVIVGGCLVLIFTLLSIIFGTKFKRIPKICKLKWEFEKKVYFSFGILCSFFTLLMILIAVANLSNALNPLQGFSLFVGQYIILKGTNMSALHRTFNEWIIAGNKSIPLILEKRINENAQFHTTKAIVCGILLIIFIVLSKILWTDGDSRCKHTRSFCAFSIISCRFFAITECTGMLSPPMAMDKWKRLKPSPSSDSD